MDTGAERADHPGVTPQAAGTPHPRGIPAKDRRRGFDNTTFGYPGDYHKGFRPPERYPGDARLLGERVKAMSAGVNEVDEMSDGPGPQYSIGGYRVIDNGVMLYIHGRSKSSFRCSCHCNVFSQLARHDADKPNSIWYACNSCSAVYESEK